MRPALPLVKGCDQGLDLLVPYNYRGPMPSPGPDARRLLHHVRALVRRFAVSERADVFCCGMTIAQAATLETLRLEGGLRMGELGRRLGITPSTLTRNLQRLLDAGYVKREADGEDGRAAVVALTATGRRQA